MTGNFCENFVCVAKVGIKVEEDVVPSPLRMLTALFAILVMVLSGRLIQAQGPNKPQIGFSLEAAKGHGWQADLDAFTARAKLLGAEVISSDAQGDDDLQLQQAKAMIKAGIKVL